MQTVRYPWLAALLLLALTFASAAGTDGRAETATREQVVAAIPKLQELAKEIIASGGVPGLAIAIVHKSEVVYLGGYGVREAGKSGAVDADTVFQLASLSKPISATVVAALVSEGIVKWDSRIADLDPSFRLQEAYPTEQVTIRDLFAHRSGLSGNAGNDLEEIGFARDTILHRLRHLEPASSFRSAFAYSNFGLTEGAVAAAKPTGKSWEHVAEEMLYKPLGMTATSSRYSDFLKRTNRSSLHVQAGGTWAPLVKRNPDPQSPAGGISSSARDLTRWMLLQLGNGKVDGKQLIEEQAIAQSHVPLMERGNHAVTGSPSFYGLGWTIRFGPHGTVWAHAGAFSQGARTAVSLIPSQQLGIVVLSNAFPTGVPDALASSFFDFVFTGSLTRDWVSDWNKIYTSLFGPAIEQAKKLYGTPPASAAPALPLSAYAGTYSNAYVGTAVIAEDNGSLMLKLGPDGTRSYALKHFDRDLFTYIPAKEMPDLPSAVTFQIGPDQKASQVTIENLNSDGQGILVRTVTDAAE